MELSYTIDDDLWLVEVDEGQIRQVIRHLAVNAKEAMPEGGVLKIGAKNLHVKNHDLLPVAEGTYVRISVEDTGIGISEKDLNHIFDPYYSTKQIGTQKGMGLALAVCYSIVNRHHGCITAASQKGEGSSFHVYLPVMTGETSVKSLIPKKRQEVKKSRKKVLVMDDESMVREVTEHLLTASGYDVELASDGLEAISLYVKANEANDPFNVVFLDLSVKGGLGGKPTLKRLMEIDPHVMAIVSTGYTDDPIIHDFRDYGFMGAVTKPFTLEKLTGALAKVC
jgi:CheY-like chemotaxis protein